MAVISFLEQKKAPRLALQATLCDDRLLAGSVPQPPDWLRAWRAARTPQSWQAAQDSLRTEHFIRPCRDRSVQARPLAKMATILREVIRQEKRSLLRRTASISLSLDDRKGYKLVRFRCMAPAGDPGASPGEDPSTQDAGASVRRALSTTGGWAYEGILGCVRCLRGSSMEDFAEDYGVRAAAEVVTLLHQFCTPMAGAEDTLLFEEVARKVHALCADGALQKVAGVLRERTFKQVVIVQRDPAHMVRIACKDPLMRNSKFEEQHERLFGKTHGLLRQIQFSDGLQSRLEACQQTILLHRRTMGGGVQQVMRHFSFAPHRFESWTAPRRKYACAIHAVALLLAEMAGDSRRQGPERKQAQEALAAMTTENLVEVGMCADFGEVCMRCALCWGRWRGTRLGGRPWGGMWGKTPGSCAAWTVRTATPP